MNPTFPSLRNSRAGRMAGTLLAVLGFATSLAGATQWDMSAGDYHTHLLSTETGFQLHVHDKATHQVVDTRKGKVVATLLAGGRTQVLPLSFLQAGVLTGDRVLTGDWTLLVRFDVPGLKPAQVRYSSKMKPGAQDVVPADAKAAVGKDHDHDHGHSHNHDEHDASPSPSALGKK